MRIFLLVIALFGIALISHGQNIYQIRADSVRIYNNCDTAELILENRTQAVPGYLFNKGRGRTEFRRMRFLNLGNGLISIGDQDTLDFSNSLSGSFIKNQYTLGQTADYWVNGKGRVDKDFYLGGGMLLNSFKNNAAGDSVLTTDMNGNVKMKAVAAGAGFIQNQYSAAQGANYWIRGAGRVDSFLTLSKYKNNATEDSVLTTDINGKVKLKSGGNTNIYNSDGTITGSRTVAAQGTAILNRLEFDNFDYFTVHHVNATFGGSDLNIYSGSTTIHSIKVGGVSNTDATFNGSTISMTANSSTVGNSSLNLNLGSISMATANSNNTAKSSLSVYSGNFSTSAGNPTTNKYTTITSSENSIRLSAGDNVTATNGPSITLRPLNYDIEIRIDRPGISSVPYSGAFFEKKGLSLKTLDQPRVYIDTFRRAIYFKDYLNNTAEDSVLTTDVNGRLKFKLVQGGSGGSSSPIAILKDFYTPVAIAATTPNVDTILNYTTLYTYSLLVNRLANNGEKMKLAFGGSFAGERDTKYLDLLVAGTSVTNNGFFANVDVGTWDLSGWMIRTGTTTASITIVMQTNNGEGPFQLQTDLTGLNFTQPISIALNGTSNSGIAGSIVAKMGTISWEAAAQ